MWTVLGRGQVGKAEDFGCSVASCRKPVGKAQAKTLSSLQDTAVAEFIFKEKAWNSRTQCKTNIFWPLCLVSVKHMGSSVYDFAFAELRFELLASLFLTFKQPCNSICVCFNFTLSIKSTVHDELEKWPLVMHRNLISWCVTLSYFSALQTCVPLSIKNTLLCFRSPPLPQLCRWGSGDARVGWDQPGPNLGHSTSPTRACQWWWCPVTAARWGDMVVMIRTVASPWPLVVLGVHLWLPTSSSGCVSTCGG